MSIEDTGKHYRFSFTKKLTETDIKNGYVTINLDPFRIATIYKMSSFALQTILKKCLCAGNRGHNSVVEDLKDIICAAQREIEILEEDAVNSELK